MQQRWRSERAGEAAESSVEETGSEVGLESLNSEEVEEWVLRVGKPHGQNAQVGRRMAWQILIGRAGQPE